jgi:hypothetical protein
MAKTKTDPAMTLSTRPVTPKTRAAALRLQAKWKKTVREYVVVRIFQELCKLISAGKLPVEITNEGEPGDTRIRVATGESEMTQGSDIFIAVGPTFRFETLPIGVPSVPWTDANARVTIRFTISYRNNVVRYFRGSKKTGLPYTSIAQTILTAIADRESRRLEVVKRTATREANVAAAEAIKEKNAAQITDRHIQVYGYCPYAGLSLTFTNLTRSQAQRIIDAAAGLATVKPTDKTSN